MTSAMSIVSSGSVDRFGVSWAGRSVAVIGLGKSGLAASTLLQQRGCRVRISDRQRTEPLVALTDQLLASGIEAVELGEHRRSFLEGCDLVVVSPGVPESSAPIQFARELGLPIIGEVELAYRFCAAPVVAVTGTNGKSTAVTLIHRVLTAAGKSAVACGNLGIPCCDVLPSLAPDAIAVVEVSSFQLVSCEEFRPSIAVLLNLGTNHLDWHADGRSYVAAKARLFRRQTPQDYAVLNARNQEVVALASQIRAQRIWFGASEGNLPAFSLSPATCAALAENRQAVLQVARILGIPDPLTHQVIREFRGLEHRLEHVATIRGVRFINDSKSTTPDSLLYALERCPGSLIPIIGGKDKGMDFRPLHDALEQERIRAVVLIGETRQRLRAILNGSIRAQECPTLREALQAAMQVAEPGDAVLFSPACASFDMFRNFEERGQQFKRLVEQLERRWIAAGVSRAAVVCEAA